MKIIVHRLIAFTLRVIFRANGPLNVVGRENIPPERGVIVASNHISYIDPPLIGAVLPRKATFIARKGLFDIPLLGWFLKFYAFPIDREKAHPSTIKEAVRRLKNGELIVIFPEGRRSETGKLLEGKRGIGMIAQLSGAAVVPTLVIGTNRALPFGARWLKRAEITVVFDSPFYPSPISGKGGRISGEITGEIMNGIRKLQERYGYNNS
jgi:1-acyl-sn-glycerol-3-phosphate acyltransferase